MFWGRKKLFGKPEFVLKMHEDSRRLCTEERKRRIWAAVEAELHSKKGSKKEISSKK